MSVTNGLRVVLWEVWDYVRVARRDHVLTISVWGKHLGWVSWVKWLIVVADHQFWMVERDVWHSCIAGAVIRDELGLDEAYLLAWVSVHLNQYFFAGLVAWTVQRTNRCTLIIQLVRTLMILACSWRIIIVATIEAHITHSLPWATIESNSLLSQIVLFHMQLILDRRHHSRARWL